MIGNGNVAADVARMLVLTRAELDETDTADHAIEPLADSGVEEIVILGRRGPAQAAFTNPEVRELGEMVDADIVIDPAEVELDEVEPRVRRVRGRDPTNRRNVEIFTDFAGREPEGKRRRDRAAVPALARSRSRVTAGSSRSWSAATGSSARRRPRLARVDTGEREEIECGLVLRSIGYKGIGLDGLPFDDARRDDPERPRPGGRPESGEQVAGQYVVGWIKRGPSGVIGTNKKDAQDTVARAARGRRPRAGCPSRRATPRPRRSRRCCAERGAGLRRPSTAGARSTRARSPAASRSAGRG